MSTISSESGRAFDYRHLGFRNLRSFVQASQAANVEVVGSTAYCQPNRPNFGTLEELEARAQAISRAGTNLPAMLYQVFNVDGR
jgi:hypothetical protein